MEQENKKIRDIIEAFEDSSSNNFEHLPILVNHIGEYLDSFVMVGFDNDGNRVTASVIKSERDFDGLSKHIYRVNRIFENNFEKEFEGQYNDGVSE